jgi:hypothetical protein
MAVGVHVRPVPKLTEVRAVGEQLPGAGGRHPEPVSELGDRCSPAPGGEHGPDLLSLMAWQKPTGDGLPLVTARCLVPRPDAARDRVATKRVEPLAMHVELELGHRGEQVAREPPGGRRRIESFGDADDLPPAPSTRA